MRPGLIYRVALLVFLTLPVIAPDAKAVNNGSPASRDQLLFGSARSTGMGRLGSILDDGSVAIWDNPAMLVFDEQVRFGGTGTDLAALGDYRFWTSELFGPVLKAGDWRVSLGAGFAYLEDRNTHHAMNYLGATSSKSYQPYDMLVNIALSGSFREWIGIGAALEYTRSLLRPAIPEFGYEEIDGTAITGSFGIAIRPTFHLLEEKSGERMSEALLVSPVLGASVLHLGQDIRYNDSHDGDPLPRQRNLGAGIRFSFLTDTTGPFLQIDRFRQWEFFFGYEQNKSIIGAKDDIRHWGLELGLFGMFYSRVGRFIDKSYSGSDFIDTPWGFGFGTDDLFPVTISIDWASIQKVPGMPREDHWEVSFSTNPVLPGF